MEQTVKEIALESLLKTIGYMVIIENKDYAKQLSDIYVEILGENEITISEIVRRIK